MTDALPTLPKAFAVWFEDLDTWSVRSFFSINWRWPDDHVRPLGDALERKRDRVPSDEKSLDELDLITLRFDGSMEVRDTGSKSRFKGALYYAEPGDVVYSKIDVRNGAIGVVPNEHGRVAVSTEFPVYAVRREVALPEYVKQVFRTVQFRQLINSMISGASGRKRVKPAQIESLEVPFPPLATQRAIVAAWEDAKAKVAALQAEADAAEERIPNEFVSDLGLSDLHRKPIPRVFAVMWKDLRNWHGEATHLLSQLGDLDEGDFPVVTGERYIRTVRNGCSSAPSRKETGLRVLKISAVTKGRLDLDECKPIADKKRYRKRFELRRGDVLLCRTNGTLDYVGMSALVEENLEDYIFPDKVIRVRPRLDEIEPEYLWLVLQLPHIRIQIEAAARTAVGNYAIGGSDVWNFKIPLPPLDIQRGLVETVRKRRAKVRRLRAEATKREEAARERLEAIILGTEPPPS